MKQRQQICTSKAAAVKHRAQRPLNTLLVISETIFSTNQLTDISKTKQNYKQQQHRTLNNH